MEFSKEVAKSYLKYCHNGWNDEALERVTYNGHDGWFIEDGLNRLEIEYDSIEDKMVVDEHWVTENDSYTLGGDPEWVSYKERGEDRKYFFSLLENEDTSGKILNVEYQSEKYLREEDTYGGENPNNGSWGVEDSKYQYIVPDDFEILNGLDGIELKKLEESAKGAKR